VVSGATHIVCIQDDSHSIALSLWSTGDDVKGGTERFRPGVLELLYKIASQTTSSGSAGSGGISKFFRSDTNEENGDMETKKTEENTLIVPVVEANETFL